MRGHWAKVFRTHPNDRVPLLEMATNWSAVIGLFLFWLGIKISLNPYISLFAKVGHFAIFSGLFLFILDVVLIYQKFFGINSVVELPVEMKEMSDTDASIAYKLERLLSPPKVLVDRLNVAVKTSTGEGYAIPEVFVEIHGASGFVYIENIGGNSSQLKNENLSSAISSVFTGDVRGFSIVQQSMTEDGNWGKFEIEDTAIDNRFYIHGTVTPYISSNPHTIRLAEDLEWTPSNFHLAIVGRTGSGKSELVGVILSLAELQGWDVQFHSAKVDGLVYRYGGESDVPKIIDHLEKAVELMKFRQALISKKLPGQMQVDYRDLPELKDIVIAIDEMGMINDEISGDKTLKVRLDSALGQLAKGARSAGIHLILMAQYASSDSFKPAYRQQLTGRFILGASSGLERQFLMPGYEDNGVAYGQAEGLAQFDGTTKWQTPRHYKAPWIIKE